MKVYSNYDYEERLYSTGSDELDDLLERAFCEGYEYAQKEFGIMDNARPIMSGSRIANNAAKVVNRSGRTATDVLKSNKFKGSAPLGQKIGPIVTPRMVNAKAGAMNATNALKKIPANKLGAVAALGTLGAAALGASAIKRAKRKGWEDAKMGVQRTAKY